MIVREYRPLVAGVAALALLLQATSGTSAALIPWAVTVLLLWLFRDPPCHSSVHPLGLLSPVRGMVSAAGPGDDPYTGRAGHRVQVEADWRGPYRVRSPIEGVVIAQWGEWREPTTQARRRGRALHIRTDEGDEVLLSMAGRLSVGLARNLGIGDRVGHAQALGLMPFGGRAAIHFAGHGRVLVAAGQRVVAGVDQVAELLHD